jgi:hypothetical protein
MHDFARPVTLFTALNHLDGKVIGRNAERRDHDGWLSFVKLFDRQTAGLELHVIADNARHSQTHRDQAVADQASALSCTSVLTASSWLTSCSASSPT